MAYPVGMEQHLGLQFLQLPPSLLLQILWAASLLCVQFHGEGASFCRSPALPSLEVMRDSHGFRPVLIGSSVSHASSLRSFPHFPGFLPDYQSRWTSGPHRTQRQQPAIESTSFRSFSGCNLYNKSLFLNQAAALLFWSNPSWYISLPQALRIQCLWSHGHPKEICSWWLGKVTLKAGLVSLSYPFSFPPHKTGVVSGGKS